MKFSNVLYRKIIAAIFTILLFTCAVSVFFMVDFHSDELLSSEIIGISLVVAFYTIPIILFYGIPVSLFIEYVSLKHLPSSSLLYIGLHSFFGIASYFFFWEWGGVIYGIIAATLFACSDRLLSLFRMTDKLIIASIVIPIGLYAFCTILIAAIG